MIESTSEPMNVLAVMLRDLLPESVSRAMREHDEAGGDARVVLPGADEGDEVLTQVVFEPSSVVALFKLGEDPAQVIWGEQIPDADAFLACVRVEGDLQAHLCDLEGNLTPLDRAPGAAPYDFGDLPVTELIGARGSRSDGKDVRERVNAAQREIPRGAQAHVDDRRRQLNATPG
jgi:hypothetical protein